MIEIRYKDQYEVTDLAGCTVSEARARYQEELGIPAKAYVKLNGSKLKTKAEGKTVINDDDRLSFGVSHPRGAYYLAALLLALAITGGVFASGFINGSASITGAVLANNNFAEVTVNSTGINDISWNGYGFFKGAVGSTYPTHSVNGTPIFNINTYDSGYTGDLVVTVSLGNADQLAKKYRVLALKLAMENSANQTLDINESGAADSNDWVMLTLDNGSVNMYPGGISDNMTVRVMSGFYITQVKPFGTWNGDDAPQLFAEVAQR
jgi:hypothetical protein